MQTRRERCAQPVDTAVERPSPLLDLRPPPAGTFCTGCAHKIFGHWRMCPAAISYPHWEFDVQRHPRRLPGQGRAASRSADLPGAARAVGLEFECVFEDCASGYARPATGRPGFEAGHRYRRAGRSGWPPRIRQPAAHRAAGPGLGDDHCGRSGAGFARVPILTSSALGTADLTDLMPSASSGATAQPSYRPAPDGPRYVPEYQ